MALRNVDATIELHRVSNGEEAIKFLLRAAPYRDAPVPNLIVLDLNLPRKSGFDVLVEITSQPNLAFVPVFVVTSSGMDYDRERALRLGAQGFFEKPDSLDGLASLAEQICSVF